MSLLDVCDLRVTYPGRPDPVIRGVSLTVDRGETLGLVGESGSGKSTIGHAVVGLVRPSGGRIRFHGTDITYANLRLRRELSSQLQIVFQDPQGSLNPSRTIGSMLAEPLRVVQRMTRSAATARVAEVLAEVGMPPGTGSQYPAALSGGQRQRVAIARALVLRPELIVCDEPTSALDLSVQAQILNLLLDLQARFGLSYLFVSHDLDVVRLVCHRAAVLFGGRIVDEGPVEQVMTHPAHPYTRALLDAVPPLTPGTG